MGFYIQYTCEKCGFKTPDGYDALIDPLGMPELYISSCSKCHSMFHRKKDSNGNVKNECPNCGNTDILVYKHVYEIPCPNCDNEELSLECVGMFF